MPLFDTTTTLEDSLVSSILSSHWDLSLGPNLKKSQNFTYECSDPLTQSRYVVRVTPDPSGEQLPRIRLELKLICYMRAGGVFTPRIVPKRGSTNSEDVENLLIHETNLVLVVFEYAVGRPLAFHGIKWFTEPKIIDTWGTTLGRIHRLSKQFEQQYPDVAKQFRDYDQLHERILKDVHIDPRDVEVKDDPDRWGILHGDFNISNFFYEDSTSTICLFDWDQAQRGWFLYDVAQVLFGIHLLKSAGIPLANPPQPAPAECDPRYFTESFLKAYSKEFGQEVEIDRLNRMLTLRKTFYEVFCRKALTEPIPPGMDLFCKFIVDWCDRTSLTFP